MSMVTLDKYYFQHILQKINQTEYNQATNVQTITPIYITALDDIAKASIGVSLQQSGYALLSFASDLCIEPSSLASWQSTFLGTIMQQSPSCDLPYFKVEAKPDSKFLVCSSYAQPLHTDEGYTSVFPSYVALYCDQQAETGGISTLFDIQKYLPILFDKWSGRVDRLTDHKCLWVDSIKKSEYKPLFLRLSPDKIGISYCATLRKMVCDEPTYTVFDDMTHYIHTPKHQLRIRMFPRQMLIIDNTRMLHGRTAFQATDKRILYRYWFGSNRIKQL